MPATINPQIIIDNITNAVISWDGTTTITNGIIQWHIPAEGGTLTANYKNYVSAWNPNYEWSGLTNMTSSFNGLSNTCHISAMVSLKKYTVVTTSNVSEYNDIVYTERKDAETALASIKTTLANGDYGYTVEVRGSAGAYQIYKITLTTITDNLGSYNVTKDVNVSSYITKQEKPEPDPEPPVEPDPDPPSPTPSAAWSHSGTSVSVTISNTTVGEKYELTVTATNSGTSYNQTGTGNGSSITLSRSSLSTGTNYVAQVISKSGTTITNSSYSFRTQEDVIVEPTCSITQLETLAQAQFYNLKTNDKIELKLVVYNGGVYSSTSDTADSSATSLSLSISNITPGVYYIAEAYVNSKLIASKEIYKSTTPNSSISINDNKITFYITGLNYKQKVGVFIREDWEGSPQDFGDDYTRSSKGSSSSVSFSWTGKYNTVYIYSITITEADGSTWYYLREKVQFKFEQGEQPDPDISYNLTNITTDSVTVNISGALPAQNVAVSFYGVDAVYGTINPNGTASITVSNLAVGKRYSGSIRVGDTTINNVVFYTLFEWWLSHPVQGNTMGTYNNSPAPVKAEEWNRLVALINSKLSKNIDTVASGDEMNAGSGGNVKVVASALGVSIESKAKVTASFFDALKSAINNIKG